jgi:hypothetical protein
MKSLSFFLFFLVSVYADCSSNKILFEEPFYPRCSCLTSFSFTTDWNWFLEKKNGCLGSNFFQEKIGYINSQDRYIFFIPGVDVVVKKRKQDCLKEVCAWEISSWLGSFCPIIPTFPIEIGNHSVVIQRKEVLFAKGMGIERIPVAAYWETFLLAYILGCRDLSLEDMGIDSTGRIRLFDLQGCFHYDSPKAHKGRFHPGFWTELLCFPHYRMPLAAADVGRIKQFIALLQCIEDNIRTYLFYRSCSFNIDLDALFFRIYQVKNFLLFEGVTLCDLYKHLFPCMGEGLDELRLIIGSTKYMPIDHGEALRFLMRGSFSHKTRKQIQKWISSYGCDR